MSTPASSPSAKPWRLRERLAGVRCTVATALLCLALPAAAETLAVGGIGTGLGTMRVLATEFSRHSPGISVVVMPDLGSTGGLKALSAGVIDIAVVGRPLRKEEAARNHVVMDYGKTPFVFATSRRDAEGFLGLSEVADVYAGRRTHWPDGTPIRLVLRRKGGMDARMLQALSAEMDQAVATALARPGMFIPATDEETVDALERRPEAIGTTTLALIRSERRQLQALALHGVAPSPQALAQGSYPHHVTMSIVRRAQAKETARRFFDFVASAQGRQILTDLGHWVPQP